MNIFQNGLNCGIVVYNKTEIIFSNKSSIKATATSSSAARGSSCNVIILDEMAFIPTNVINEFFASVMPIISSSKSSKAIVVSTPNGAQGLYYDIWTKANSKNTEENSEGWKPFRIRWQEVPGRDLKWKEQQIATVGIERWRQEFECDFLTSTTKRLIPEDIIDQYSQKFGDKIFKELSKGKKLFIISETESKMYEFTMWHSFDLNRTYAASADIAEGLGGNSDCSVLYVWDITQLDNIILCAKFSSNAVSTVEFAFVINKILSLYNKPWLICERNGISGGMIDSLRITYQYANIVQEGKNNAHGIFSHVQIKSKACLWAREMMTTKGFGFTIYDRELIEEMGTFVKKDSKGVHSIYTALTPAHDDCMMTFIWLCYLLNAEIIEKYYIVLDTFKSNLDQIYPSVLAPLNEYNVEDLGRVNHDKLNLEFKEYQDILYKSLKLSVSENDRNIIENKMLAFQVNKNNRQVYDPYFTDDDGPSWDNSSDSIPRVGHNLNAEHVRPSFFINSGGGFY